MNCRSHKINLRPVRRTSKPTNHFIVLAPEFHKQLSETLKPIKLVSLSEELHKSRTVRRKAHKPKSSRSITSTYFEGRLLI
jgi:hypothetical protein